MRVCAPPAVRATLAEPFPALLRPYLCLLLVHPSPTRCSTSPPCLPLASPASPLSQAHTGQPPTCCASRDDACCVHHRPPHAVQEEGALLLPRSPPLSLRTARRWRVRVRVPRRPPALPRTGSLAPPLPRRPSWLTRCRPGTAGSHSPLAGPPRRAEWRREAVHARATARMRAGGCRGHVGTAGGLAWVGADPLPAPRGRVHVPRTAAPPPCEAPRVAGPRTRAHTRTHNAGCGGRRGLWVSALSAPHR